MVTGCAKLRLPYVPRKQKLQFWHNKGITYRVEHHAWRRLITLCKLVSHLSYQVDYVFREDCIEARIVWTSEVVCTQSASKQKISAKS